MSKDYLEAWNFIKDQMQNFTFSHLIAEMVENADIVDNALQRLEVIDNSKPSEALKSLGLLGNFEWHKELFKEVFADLFDIIEQTLQKAQEMEKENAELKTKTQEQEKLLNTIFQNFELDENYSEQCSGSTKAYKLVIPNCISVEEDENYTDDSFPNSDFEVIDNFVKERTKNE